MQMYLQLVKVSDSMVPHLVCLVPLSHELLINLLALGPSGRSSTACVMNFKLGLAEDLHKVILTGVREPKNVLEKERVTLCPS